MGIPCETLEGKAGQALHLKVLQEVYNRLEDFLGRLKYCLWLGPSPEAPESN